MMLLDYIIGNESTNLTELNELCPQFMPPAGLVLGVSLVALALVLFAVAYALAYIKWFRSRTRRRTCQLEFLRMYAVYVTCLCIFFLATFFRTALPTAYLIDWNWPLVLGFRDAFMGSAMVSSMLALMFLCLERVVMMSPTNNNRLFGIRCGIYVTLLLGLTCAIFLMWLLTNECLYLQLHPPRNGSNHSTDFVAHCSCEFFGNETTQLLVVGLITVALGLVTIALLVLFARKVGRTRLKTGQGSARSSGRIGGMGFLRANLIATFLCVMIICSYFLMHFVFGLRLRDYRGVPMLAYLVCWFVMLFMQKPKRVRLCNILGLNCGRGPGDTEESGTGLNRSASSVVCQARKSVLLSAQQQPQQQQPHKQQPHKQQQTQQQQPQEDPRYSTASTAPFVTPPPTPPPIPVRVVILSQESYGSNDDVFPEESRK